MNPPPAGPTWVHAAVAALYCALTVAFLWPLPLDPAGLVISNPDVYGNSWALAWVVHQVRTAPRHLMDANIFFPVPQAFAFTEPLLPQALQAAPVILAGGGPLLAHNLVLLATFPLCGLAAYWLALEVFGSRTGAVLAGVGYAFCAYRFAHLVHVQSLSMQWLPLAVLFLRRSLLGGGNGSRALLGLFAALTALSSGYYAVVLGLAMAVVLAWHAREGLERRTLAPAILPLALAALVSAVVYLPNREGMRRESEVRGYQVMRSPEEMIDWSAGWGSYLDPGRTGVLPTSRVLNRRFGGREPLFAGLVVLALALLGLGRVRSSIDVRIAAGLVIVGVLASLGPRIDLFGHVVHGPLDLVRRIPPLTSLRTPGRFGVLALLGLGLLAAAGWATLGPRLRSRLFVPVLLLQLLDVWPSARATLEQDPPAPPTAAWLRTAPRGVVLELPWDHETEVFGARYIYWSTTHWQQMVNGWGGYYPKGPFELAVSAKRFPSPDSSRELRRTGVRYVVVHLDLMPETRRTRILATTDLPEGVSLAADLGPHRIYEIDPSGPRERQDRGNRQP